MGRVTAATTIDLVVNGEKRQVEADNVAALLIALDYDGAAVATALNGDFVSRRKREATALREGDRVEILAPRQGG